MTDEAHESMTEQNAEPLAGEPQQQAEQEAGAAVSGLDLKQLAEATGGKLITNEAGDPIGVELPDGTTVDPVSAVEALAPVTDGPGVPNLTVDPASEFPGTVEQMPATEAEFGDAPDVPQADVEAEEAAHAKATGDELVMDDAVPPPMSAEEHERILAEQEQESDVPPPPPTRRERELAAREERARAAREAQEG